MFDDPKKALRQMEEALLAEGFDEEEETAQLPEEEEEDWDTLPRYNPAVDFARTVYDDEEFDDDAALTAPPKGRRGRKKAKKEARRLAKQEKKRRKKEKGVGILMLIALGEIAVIAMLIRWWIQWLK